MVATSVADSDARSEVSSALRAAGAENAATASAGVTPASTATIGPATAATKSRAATGKSQPARHVFTWPLFTGPRPRAPQGTARSSVKDECMRVGADLLSAARATGSRCVVFVGTGKNVGKTVAMRSVYEAACERDIACGLVSIGRDGEAADVAGAHSKPRLFLRPGTVVATARDVLPRSPASEVIAFSNLPTAAGALIYARVVHPAFYELIGPPTASGMRQAIDSLKSLAELVLVDGAVDRVAALAGGDDAVVVSCGAAAAGTMQEAVDDVRALARRLSVQAVDPERPLVRVAGAFTASAASAAIARGERRQIVVRDPTQIALSGKVFLSADERLDLRCERPLRVVGVTVASIGRDRGFEPRAFACAVAAATSLPVYDVYASERTVA